MTNLLEMMIINMVEFDDNQLAETYGNKVA